MASDFGPSPTSDVTLEPEPLEFENEMHADHKQVCISRQ